MAVRVLSVSVAVSFAACFASTAYAQNGLMGEYYNSGGGATPQPPPGSPAGTTSTATPLLTRIDADINFNWAQGSPDPAVPVNGFMVAWTGRITINNAGDYQFRLNIDDGGRMWIDGVLVPLQNAAMETNSWRDQAATAWTGTVAGLTAGTHNIRVEFYENGGEARCEMSYSGPDNSNTMGIVPTNVLQPPPPPSVPAITVVQTPGFVNGADVSWTNSGTGVTYDLQRAVNGGTYTTIQTGLTGLTYQDTGLNYGSDYCYQVRAVQGILMSAFSTPDCVMLQAPPPRTNDHDEGMFDGNCACGSSIGAPAPFSAALAALALLAAFRRRR